MKNNGTYDNKWHDPLCNDFPNEYTHILVCIIDIVKGCKRKTYQTGYFIKNEHKWHLQNTDISKGNESWILGWMYIPEL